MRRVYRQIFTVGLAAACYGQPAPPAPAAPPAPVVAPADVAEPLMPREQIEMMKRDIEEAADRIRTIPVPPVPAMKFDFDFDFDFKEDTLDRARAAIDEARDRAADRFDLDGMKAMIYAQLANPKPMPMPKPATAPVPPSPPSSRDLRFVMADRGRSRDSEERLYRRGSEYLDKREWEKAADTFEEVIEKKGTKADGAYYWKAYALSKLGRRDQALSSLAELRKTYPHSRWLNDAKALEAEVQQASGQGVSPESESDEDLKLFAINNLINTDPERAIPLLDKLLQKNSSPKLKERALFVLAQSRTPKSTEIVTQFARGGGNPDLQQKAVEYLGIYGGKDNLQTLSDIYGSANDLGLKRTILRSFMVARDKDRLLAAAKNEQNPDLRRDAIQYLGNLGAYPELVQLYGTEQAFEAKEAIIQSLANGGNAEKLIEIARTEKDQKLRRTAIHRLGTMSRSKTAEPLVALYASETDTANKEQIIHALFTQGSVKELVDVARKESDPNLKRLAVQMLSRMNSKEATDFLIELLNK
jgi:HEAT repeat protein